MIIFKTFQMIEPPWYLWSRRCLLRALTRLVSRFQGTPLSVSVPLGDVILFAFFSRFLFFLSWNFKKYENVLSQIFFVGGTIGSVVPLIGPTTASDWLPLYLAKTDNFIFYRLIGILNGHFIYRIELAMIDYPYIDGQISKRLYHLDLFDIYLCDISLCEIVLPKLPTC